MAEEEDYKVDRKKPRKTMGTGAKIGFGALALIAIGVVGYPILQQADQGTIETSGTSEFQDDGTDSGFARIEAETPAPAEPQVDFSGVTAQFEEQRAELERQNQAFAEQIAALESQIANAEPGEVIDRAAIDNQILDAVTAANAESQRLFEEMQRTSQEQIAAIQAELEAARAATAAAERQAEMDRLEAERQAEIDRLEAEAQAAERARIEAENARRRTEAEAAQRQAFEAATAEERARQEELQRIREEQRAQLEARVQSPSVVFDGGSSASGSGSSTEAGQDALPRNPTAEERNRAFVESGGSTVEVTNSQVIANPSQTVIQGTMIAATLENAVDSSLPGSVTAVVSNPIWSFDGANILIPSGSRVFGSYSSDVSLGQSRILVRWSRIVTPQGQSVSIAAFGGDQQGRSGMTGRVDSRFGQRFGGAALISLIGAVPSLAAASANTDNQVVIDTAENIGDDFSTATANVINEYATLPPIISVEQGSVVTIMVDRDLEFF